MSAFFLNTVHMVSFSPKPAAVTSSKPTSQLLDLKRSCDETKLCAVFQRPPRLWITPLDCKQLCPTAETNRCQIHQSIRGHDFRVLLSYTASLVIFQMCSLFYFYSWSPCWHKCWHFSLAHDITHDTLWVSWKCFFYDLNLHMNAVTLLMEGKSTLSGWFLKLVLCIKGQQQNYYIICLGRQVWWKQAVF